MSALAPGKTKNRSALGKKTITLGNKLAHLKVLIQDLGAATAKIAKQRPGPAARITKTVDEVRANVGAALARLTALNSEPEAKLAEMPKPDAESYYPAAETLRAIIAIQIAERRLKAGLSQQELAKKAGVRQETISRLESGKHAPTVRTVEKIDRALSHAGA